MFELKLSEYEINLNSKLIETNIIKKLKLKLIQSILIDVKLIRFKYISGEILFQLYYSYCCGKKYETCWM